MSRSRIKEKMYDKTAVDFASMEAGESVPSHSHSRDDIYDFAHTHLVTKDNLVFVQKTIITAVDFAEQTTTTETVWVLETDPGTVEFLTGVQGVN